MNVSLITKILFKMTGINTYSELSKMVTINYDDSIRDNEGNTALMIACEENLHQIVKIMLLSSGETFDLNAVNNDGDTVLHIAIKNHNKALCSLLLDYNIDTNIPNKDGDTPIKLIFNKNNYKNWASMCTTLLTKSSSKINLDFYICDYDPCNSYGSYYNPAITPLIWACRENYSDLIKLMLCHDINVNLKSQNEISPLSCYILGESGYDIEIVKLLIEEHGANVNDNNFILHDCCTCCEDLNLIKLLIKNGININSKNRESITPLMSLIYSGHNDAHILQKVFNILLNNDNILLNISDDLGDNVLHYCMYKQLKPILIKQLLQKNIDINSQNYNGDTPLHLACTVDNINIVKLLLQYDAKVDIYNNKGQLPIDMTANSKIREILINAYY